MSLIPYRRPAPRPAPRPRAEAPIVRQRQSPAVYFKFVACPDCHAPSLGRGVLAACGSEPPGDQPCHGCRLRALAANGDMAGRRPVELPEGALFEPGTVYVSRRTDQLSGWLPGRPDPIAVVLARHLRGEWGDDMPDLDPDHFRIGDATVTERNLAAVHGIDVPGPRGPVVLTTVQSAQRWPGPTPPGFDCRIWTETAGPDGRGLHRPGLTLIYTGADGLNVDP